MANVQVAPSEDAPSSKSFSPSGFQSVSHGSVLASYRGGLFWVVGQAKTTGNTSLIESATANWVWFKLKKEEATETIQTVIAQYSQSPEFSYFRSQVGAVTSSKKEATDAIQAVNVQYGYTPEFSAFRNQVGAVLPLDLYIDLVLIEIQVLIKIF